MGQHQGHRISKKHAANFSMALLLFKCDFPEKDNLTTSCFDKNHATLLKIILAAWAMSETGRPRLLAKIHAKPREPRSDDGKHAYSDCVDRHGRVFQVEGEAEQRAVLDRFDKIVDAALQPFFPFADPRQILDWHGTGDGWYINMKGLSPAVVMRFAVGLEEKLITDNPSHPDYPLRLRIGLVLGDVERAGEQWLSRAYTEANRLVDHAWTKAVLADEKRGSPAVLVASTLFMDKWRACGDKESAALKIPDAPPWTQVKFDIKHGETLSGYMRIEKSLLDTIVAPLSPDLTTVDLTSWLEGLLDRTDTLEIRGIGSGAGRQREAGKHPIEQLYTPLRSQGGLDKREGREEQKTVSLAELLPGYPRLLIEGQPGAGKTTFLKMVAAMLAKDLLKIPNPQGGHWRAQYLGMQESPRYPLFLRLSELAILLADDPKTIRDDRHRLLALLVDSRKADWQAHWLTLLEEGQAILLLDGLDEVTGDALRRRVILIAHDAVRNWPRCPVLVTSRPFGVGQMKGLDFQHVRIEPFDDKEIHTFIDRWSAALHGRSDGGRDSLSAAKHQEILLHAIMNRPAIRQLATNPVMLTCLCVVHWNEGRLPEGRARVYQAVIRWLIAARSEMRQAASYTDTFAEEAFATLALAMMEKKRRGTQAVFDLEEGAEAVLSLVSAHFSHITTKPRQLALARKWLDFECQGSGIVEEVGERRLKFWHLTFQEFLAALALAGMGDGEVQGEDWWPRIEPVLDNPQWRETVSLLPGTLWDKGGRRRVDRLLERVLAMGGEKPDLLMNARMAGIMGRLLEPMSAYQYPVPQGVEQSYRAVLKHSLDIFTWDGAQRVPIAIRLEAAEALGRNGDPRLQQRNWIEVHGTGGWLLGKYLVTVAEYRRFVEAEGYQNQRWWCEAGWTRRMEKNWENPGGWDDQTLHPNHPVTKVSWFEAMAYCRWLSEREKRTIRLPFETLWAKAATPRKGEYPWGEAKPTPELANFKRNVHAPTPVGLYPAGDGPLGHCDLAGNVLEWQRNRYSDENATISMLRDPVVSEGDWMCLRGGSWLVSADVLHAVHRGRDSAGDRYFDLGFRVAVAPSEHA